MSDKKQTVHIHHHYAPKGKPRPRARAPKHKKKSPKKVLSVVLNIIEELVRLA